MQEGLGVQGTEWQTEIIKGKISRDKNLCVANSVILRTT
jgi:hypothetical protein